MQCVIRSLSRAAALVLAGPYLLLASSLAPEHIHEPGAGHDTEHAIAHSHFGPHAQGDHHTDSTEIEHDDDHVVWLDNSILNEHLFKASPVPHVVVALVAPISAEPQWSSIPAEDAAPAHGPPKPAHRLRGPPLSCQS